MKLFPQSLVTAFNLPAIILIGLTTVPGVAAPSVSNVAPPAARVERVEPRDGYVWASGYWEWNGRSYHWVSGTYILEHRGAHWVADRWEQVGPNWQHVAGHWSTEADDGRVG
jgi:WXXGXW repeat (2 copies)